MHPRPRLPPRVALLLTILFWGASFVATKTALRDISPVTLIVLRFALGTALLLGLLRARGQPMVPPRDSWLTLAFMGFVGVFLHHLLQATALTTTTAVHAGWLIAMIPIWSSLFSVALGKERFGLVKLAGTAGGVGGAILVVCQGKPLGDVLHLPSTHGDFLILASTFTWAVYSVTGHATIKRLGPTRATAGAMLFGWLMFLPLFLPKAGWLELAHLGLRGWGAVLFLGVGCSALGYLFWYSALERIEVSRVAAFLYAQPVVTATAALFLLGEPLTIATIAGGLLVVLSVFVIQRAPA